MKRKVNFLPFFITFFSLSLLLLLLGSTGIFRDITSMLNKSAQPVKDSVYFLSLKSLQNNAIKELIKENSDLKKQLTQERNILNENIALKSQFEAVAGESIGLLPAKVIGFPGFIPGISLPDYIIIDKGIRSGVVKGEAVVSNNFLVGKVIQSYADYSKVQLITNENSSFTAKMGGATGVSGVIKGQGADELILDNVLLTQELKKGGDVLTKGDKNEKNEGYPPDVMVGKINAVEKNQSELFQRASIVSPIDFKNLDIVFVIK
jgi:rod shape-determining protein MreC